MAGNPVTTMFKYSQSEVPIFEGEHYDYWSNEMRDFFISHDLRDVIEMDYEEPPENATSATWTNEKQQDKSIYPRIFNKRKAKDAWSVLQKEFRGNDKVVSIRLQSLWRNFDNLSMRESEKISDFFTRVSEIVNHIESLGDTIQDKKIIEKILRSLPARFDHCVAAIEESKDLLKMTMHELMSSLQAHEQRINRSANQPVEQVFQSKVVISRKTGRQGNELAKEKFKEQPQRSGDGPFCIISNKTKHNSRDCRFKCERCKIPKHSQRDCWFQKKNSREANFIEEERNMFWGKNLRMKVMFVCILEGDKIHCSSQIIGCSNHMTGNRNHFEQLVANFTSQVKLGDGKMRSVQGKGTIYVCTKGGTKKLIHDVLYVPNLTHNLLSVGLLMRNGYSISFDDDKGVIFDKKKNMIVAEVYITENKVFPLVMPSNPEFALKIEQIRDSYLWHLRYGHLDMKGLHILKQKKMYYS
ncbi:hypothetical protein ABFS83_01G101200 [Erythranthe nasuta]